MARTRQYAPKHVRNRSNSPDGALWVPPRKFGTPSQHEENITLGFLHLPIDIILLILEDIFPEWFESFMLSCKSLYTVGEGMIQSYNLKRIRFRHFRYPLIDGPYHIRSSLQLLHAIAKDTTIPLYITSADFANEETSMYESGGEDHEMVLRIQEDEAMNGDIRRLLEESSYFGESEEDSNEWLDAMLQESGPHAAAFLLSLLPNAKRLAIPPLLEMPDGEVDGVIKFLDIVVARANSQKGDASLSKLRALMPHGVAEHDDGGSLDTMSRFLTIKSVRRFHAIGAVAEDDSYSAYPYHPTYESFADSLEDVELEDCVLGTTECQAFTDRIPNLRHFSYSHTMKYSGCGSGWDAASFAVALQATSGKTLETLCLKIHECHEHSGITDLKGFQVLKEVELDVQLLNAFSYTNGASNSDAVGAQMDWMRVDDNLIPRLTDLLPSSIENLRLAVVGFEDFERRLEPLLTGFLSHRERELPNLKEIHLLTGHRSRYNFKSSAEILGGVEWLVISTTGMKFYSRALTGPFSWFEGRLPGEVNRE